MIIPIQDDSTIEVRYEPRTSDALNVERMMYHHGTKAHTLETILGAAAPVTRRELAPCAYSRRRRSSQSWNFRSNARSFSRTLMSGPANEG